MNFVRTILVTGSTDGIGRQTALDLAKNPSNFVIVHGRNEERCRKSIKDIISTNKIEGVANVDFILGDFASMSSVKTMVEEVKRKFPKLNVLICNAGVLMPKRELSQNGLEMTFQVNHLAHFYLTTSLLPLLTSNQPSRIIVVSSICHDWHDIDWNDLQSEKSYEKYVQYSRSKLANHLFAFALAKRLVGTQVTCNVVEPGVVETKLLRAGGYSGSPVEKSSEAFVYLTESEKLSNVTDKYFSHGKQIIKPCDNSRDEEAQEKLWTVSEELCKFLRV